VLAGLFGETCTWNGARKYRKRIGPRLCYPLMKAAGSTFVLSCGGSKVGPEDIKQNRSQPGVLSYMMMGVPECSTWNYCCYAQA
jgi:hypothetical protein